MLVSACLLFLVQPIIAKAILPWFGGSAGVWMSCMLFFQMVLLLGYTYAHVLANRFSLAQQRIIHVLVLVVSVGLLHFSVDPLWKPAADSEPISSILGILARSVGLPYFVLCTTAPLLQHWLGRMSSLALPYRFYAISNFGSLLALASYPLLVEPLLDSETQLKLWCAAYVLFVILCLVVSVRSRVFVQNQYPIDGRESRLTMGEIGRLTAIAACSSALLLSVSNSLSQDIAPIPFLWILPLGVYLLSFTLCFDSSKWYNVAVHRVAVPMALVALTFVHAQPALPVAVVIGIHSVGLFVGCMFCHGLLSARRPPAQDLTAFYLCIACGGMLGSIFVAVAAPLIFDQLLELKIVIAGCLVIALNVLYGYSSRTFLAVSASVVLVVPLALDRAESSGETVVNRRNFYGTLSVRKSHAPGITGLSLYHGRILHGAQYSENQRTPEPGTYYGQESGAGLSLERNNIPQRVGIVGLGAGTLAWYSKPQDYYRFYEINPLVEEIARKHFSYLSHASTPVDVVIGDGRTALEREPDQRFDTLILDAFSGDSIPVHLLTLEAFSCYFKHLQRNGVLAVHVSNRYLDLTPVVEAAAYRHGKEAWFVHSPENAIRHWSAADWVVISDDKRFIAHLEGSGRARLLIPTAKRPWTDSYSNLLAALR